MMLLGILAGAKLLPQKLLRVNSVIQLSVTVLLLFTMGVAFGARPSFLHDLRATGLDSLLYAAIPGGASAVCVFFLAKRFLKEDKKK